MAESLTLDVPITRVSVDGFSIGQIVLRREAPAEIRVELVGNDGVERRVFAWSGGAALALLKALNTANLSTKSLERRVFERLVSGGLLSVSAVSGAVGDSNTFTIQVTIDDSGNLGSNQVVAVAELLNAEATGVTIS